MVCAGLALLALDGIGGDGPFGLRPLVLLLPFVGAAFIGVSPRRGMRTEPASRSVANPSAD